MSDLDPAEVMAEHEGDHWFTNGNSMRVGVLMDENLGHCLPYRLAAALVEAQEREQRVRALHYERNGYCINCWHDEHARPDKWPCRTVDALDGQP